MMTKQTTQKAVVRTWTAQTLRDLHELIAALERRVPRLERGGEGSIARAAATLKDEAIKRIADLESKSLQ